MHNESQTEQQKVKKRSNFFVKILFIALGIICLALGTVGIVLPILPTVPLYLATAFFFAKGSEKFNRWFVGTKLYKRHLENFVKNRTMTMEKKILLLTAVSAMLLIAMVLVDKLAMYIVIPIVMAAKYGYFIFRIRTTNTFKAELSSRLFAVLFGSLMIAAMFLLKNLIIYIAFSVFLAVYLIYFISAKKPQKQKETAQNDNKNIMK